MWFLSCGRCSGYIVRSVVCDLFQRTRPAFLSSETRLSVSLGSTAMPMRKTCYILASLALAHAAQGQISAPAAAAEYNPAESPASAAPAIVERGPHHKVWESTVYETTRWGDLPRTHQFTELATGMHYRETPEGPWLETVEEIEPFAEGAVARRGPHKVIFGNDLATYGSIDLEGPDGQRIRSHPLMLSYFDPATGQSVMIGEVQNCQGRIVPPNQVVYEAALTDVECTIRYTYTKAGLEQDIILLGELPEPEVWGMSSDTAILEFLTEFNAGEPPAKQARRLQYSENEVLTDEAVSFRAMKIGPGKAFSIGSGRDLPSVNVSKEYRKLDGDREFLIERVPFQQIKPHLDVLPRRSAAFSPEKTSKRRVAALKDLIPQRQYAAKSIKKNMELASVAPTSGLVLDYITMATSATNMVFVAYAGYYVTAPVNLAGTTVFEHGSCIKFPVSSTASIITSNVVFKGSHYAPVIFTAVHDSTIGENVSSGNPSLAYYGKIALDLSGASTPQLVSNARFCYMSNAVAGNITLQDVELVRCKNGFAPGLWHPTLRNVLAWNVDTIVKAQSYPGDILKAENVTAHACGTLMQDTTSAIYLTNCLFVNVTNYFAATTVTNSSVFLTGDSGIFEVVGGGSHYLAPGSPYRNTGTTNISAQTLASLRSRTTFPPLAYSNITVSIETTFYPQAQRDTDIPDIGWHYAPLDHVFGGCVAATNITFSAGTAVGWFRTTSGWNHAGHGIKANDRVVVTFAGTADQPTYWLRANLAQENCNGIWQGGYGPGGITGWAWPNFTNSPVVRANFTKFPNASWEAMVARDDNGYLTFEAANCEFLGGSFGGYISRILLTNCLFDNVSMWTSLNASIAQNSNCVFVARNCLIRGGGLQLVRSSGGTYPLWSIRDTVYDSVKFTITDGANGAAYCTDLGYNAFLQANRTNLQSTTDIIVPNSYDWQASYLGRYYLPANSTLINTGSVANAASAGFYHFTTQTNQTKESDSRIDVGYHYVATGPSGMPLDGDGDGMADYVEDANGDGTVNGVERNWTVHETQTGLTSNQRLRVYTPLKN